MANNSITSVTISPSIVNANEVASITVSGTLKKQAYAGYWGNLWYKIDDGEEQFIAYVNSATFTESTSMFLGTFNLPTGTHTITVLLKSDNTVTRTATLTVRPAVPTVAQVSLTRCTSQGIPDTNGQNVVCGVRINIPSSNTLTTPLVNVDDNDIAATTWYANSSATEGLSQPITWSSVTGSSIAAYCLIPFGDSDAHTVTVYARDVYGGQTRLGKSAVKRIPVPLLGTPIDIKEGGTGVSIGDNSVDDAFVVYLDLVILNDDGYKYKIGISQSGTLYTRRIT